MRCLTLACVLLITGCNDGSTRTDAGTLDTPPAVSLIASQPTVSAPSTITLVAAAVDNTSIAKVEFYEGTTKLSEASAPPYAHPVSFTAADDGTHTYTAKAFDTGTQSTTSAPVSVVVAITANSGGDGGVIDGGVIDGGAIDGGAIDGGAIDGGAGLDTVAPLVSLRASANTVTTASTVTLTATATDDRGVAKVELWDGLTKVAELTNPAAGTNEYRFPVALTAANNGPHRYSARAYDAAINSASSALVQVNVLIAVPTAIKQLLAGAGFAYLVRNDGSVVVAGTSQYGATGGLASGFFVPSFGLAGSAAGGASSVSYTALFVTAADGTVRCLGDGQYGQCGPGGGGLTATTVAGVSNATAVTTGSSSCALLGDGTVRCWAGYQGNPTTNSTPNPLLVRESDGGVFGAVAAVYACPETNYVLRQDGTLWGWGRNDGAQVGDGTASGVGPLLARFTPVPIRLANNTPLADVVGFSCGAAHKVAVTSDGGVVTWGANYYSQLGIPALPPNTSLPAATPAVGLFGIVGVAAGHDHTVAVDSNGSVWTWGSNSQGELGNGLVGSDIAAAVQVAGLPPIAKVAAGTSVSFALAHDGRLFSWGSAGQGVTDAGARALAPVLVVVP